MSDNTFPTIFGTSSVSGNTNFQYYDNDTEFVIDAPRFAKYATRRLGNPVLQVELYDAQLYSMYEEATLEYSSLVNTANTKYWLINYFGTSTGSLINQKFPFNSTTLYDRFLEPYKDSMGVGSKRTLYSSSITMVGSQQLYDIRQNIPVAHISSGIEIQDVLHYSPSSVGRALSNWYGGVDNIQMGAATEFGESFGMFGDTVLYYMYPLSATVQRAQQVELSDRIRRSEFTYNLHDNILRIYPLPGERQAGLNIYFTYYTNNNSSVERDSAFGDSTVDGVVDISNIPYSFISYSFINDMGKQWIKNYAYALVKETLGNIRGKFTSLPIPGDVTTLNWQELIQSAQADKQALRDQLINDLAQLDPSELIRKRSESIAAIQQQNTVYPLMIYVG